MNGCLMAHDFFYVPFVDNEINPNYFHCYSHDYLGDSSFVLRMLGFLGYYTICSTWFDLMWIKAYLS